jgi:cellulose synthase/poly-beta-1,6-N-acetylglucosamine synthase-like glycosyltransferase
MFLVEWLLTGLAGVFLVPAGVLLLQVLAALPRLPRPTGVDDAIGDNRPRLAVLIPAHNEAAGIAETLRSLRPQLTPDDRLLVVADNCTDDTAQIAASEAAEVLERSNLTHRGKGYALEFGVRHLQQSPPEVLIIIDADCCMHPGGVQRLTLRARETGCPVQALDLMQAPPDSGIRTRIAEFAWLVKNWARPLGSHRLGLPCQLMGTGMAFPWALIGNASLANSELAEDMKLGIDLALAGHPTVFCVDALVTSRFPETAKAVDSQRTRWEHGHLGMIMREAPRLLVQALMRGNLRLLGLALDLAVPPLALLTAMIALLFGVTLALLLAGLSAVPFILAASAFGLLMLSISLAWLGWGRRVLSFGALLSVPLYVLSKAPIYLNFWIKRQKDWVRTGRD